MAPYTAGAPKQGPTSAGVRRALASGSLVGNPSRAQWIPWSHLRRLAKCGSHRGHGLEPKAVASSPTGQTAQLCPPPSEAPNGSQLETPGTQPGQRASKPTSRSQENMMENTACTSDDDCALQRAPQWSGRLDNCYCRVCKDSD